MYLLYATVHTAAASRKKLVYAGAFTHNEYNVLPQKIKNTSLTHTHLFLFAEHLPGIRNYSTVSALFPLKRNLWRSAIEMQIYRRCFPDGGTVWMRQGDRLRENTYKE